MSREMCYRCFWPEPLCWCRSITPMATRTRLVFLMHPKEIAVALGIPEGTVLVYAHRAATELRRVLGDLGPGRKRKKL